MSNALASTTIKRIFIATSLLFFVSACSILGFGEEKKTASLVNYDDPEQKDHWQENLKRWYAWDTSWPQNGTTELAYEEEAITITIEADKRLNLYDGRGHTVTVKLLQLSDPSVVNEMTETSTGLASLLSNGELSANVVGSKELTIAPKEIITLSIAREMNAKFVAVLVGFSSLDPGRSHKLVPIPLVKIPPPAEEQYLTDVIADMLSSITGGDDDEEDKATYRQGRLSIQLELGNQQINAVQVAAF